MLDVAIEEIVQVLHGSKVISVNILSLTSPPSLAGSRGGAANSKHLCYLYITHTKFSHSHRVTCSQHEQ